MTPGCKSCAARGGLHEWAYMWNDLGEDVSWDYVGRPLHPMDERGGWDHHVVVRVRRFGTEQTRVPAVRPCPECQPRPSEGKVFACDGFDRYGERHRFEVLARTLADARRTTLLWEAKEMRIRAAQLLRYAVGKEQDAALHEEPWPEPWHFEEGE